MEKAPTNSVLNVKALVGTFNQEKVLFCVRDIFANLRFKLYKRVLRLMLYFFVKTTEKSFKAKQSRYFQSFMEW